MQLKDLVSSLFLMIISEQSEEDDADDQAAKMADQCEAGKQKWKV